MQRPDSEGKTERELLILLFEGFYDLKEELKGNGQPGTLDKLDARVAANERQTALNTQRIDALFRENGPCTQHSNEISRIKKDLAALDAKLEIKEAAMSARMTLTKAAEEAKKQTNEMWVKRVTPFFTLFGIIALGLIVLGAIVAHLPDIVKFLKPS